MILYIFQNFISMVVLSDNCESPETYLGIYRVYNFWDLQWILLFSTEHTAFLEQLFKKCCEFKQTQFT